MRDRIPRLFTIALIAFALACGSMPPDRIALNSLQSIKAGAESSIRVAAALRNANEIRQDQWDDAVTLYHQIEASCKTAAAGLALVTTPAQADAIVADAQRLLEQLKKLVAAFQPKPKPISWLAPWLDGGEACLVF